MKTKADSRRWGPGLRALRGGRAIVAILAVLVTAPIQPARAQLASSPWPVAGHDSQHTGLSPFSTKTNTGALKWKFPADVSSSPVIGADGTVYVPSDYLYAINFDGSLKWKFKLFTGGGESPAIGADGTIYVPDWNSLDAINPDGSLKWKLSTGNLGLPTSPVIGTDGTVYVTADGLNAINADGTLRWTFPAGASSPAIGADGTIYLWEYLVRWTKVAVCALNPDGSLRWELKIPFAESAGSPPTLGTDGTIYVGSRDNNLYAIDPDGNPKWSFACCHHSSPAIGVDGTLYVEAGAPAGANVDLFSVDAIHPDGSFKWLSVTNGPVFSSPAVGADGTIYASAFWVGLYAINRDGSRKWQFNANANRKKLDLSTPGFVSSPTIGSDGTIYVGSSNGFGDGKLYAVGPPAALHLSTLLLDFGTVGTGTTQTKKLSIRNLGRALLKVTINASGLPAPPFKATPTGSFTLAANQSKTIPVSLKPTQPGALQGEIVVSAADGEVGGVTVKAVSRPTGH